MSNQILVPSLGESVTEATVSKWLKQVGEKVDSDEPLVELETDKVNVEVPSPLSGTLSSIKVKEGDTVEVGALLGLVNKSKSHSIRAVETDTVKQEQQSYIPPKTSKEKNIVKGTLKKGDIFLVPDLDKILAKFSIVPSPPTAEPIETPILSKLTLFLSIPESSTHSLEAATPYCMNLSKRLISFFSRYFSASKDGRLAANFVSKSVTSK